MTCEMEATDYGDVSVVITVHNAFKV